MSSTSAFLGLPIELRLAVYSAYLSEHRRIVGGRQPSNQHLRLLRLCKQIAMEARPIIWSYISLLHEGQIDIFISRAPTEALQRVRWVDAANDGRLWKSIAVKSDVEKKEVAAPLSKLYSALSRLPHMTHLRVFECRQGLPVSVHSLRSGSRYLVIDFEEAMFPSQLTQALLSYELYLSANTRAMLFKQINPLSLTTLRLSGECHLPAESALMPALRDVTLLNVTGNYFDRHTFDHCFREASLRSFRYSLGDGIAFEMRDSHLRSLYEGPGRTLRSLVLLGCSRLSSSELSTCLRSLTELNYLAISLVTVEEQRTNFVSAVPSSVAVFKLHVSNAWYAIKLLAEERRMCDAIESDILSRVPPPQTVSLHFRSLLTEEEGRRAVWEELAQRHGIILHVGPWEEQEVL